MSNENEKLSGMSRRRFLRGMAFGSAALAAGALAACGGTPAAQPAQPPAAEAPAAEAPAAEAPAQSSGQVLKVTGMMWNNSPVLDENFKLRAQMFNEKYAGTYEIDLQLFPYDQYWSKLDLAYAARTPIDVYMWDVQAYSHYKAGLLRNLQDDVNMVPDFANADQYPLDLYNFWRFDGANLFGIPENIQMMALYYNKDIFDAAGIAYPDSTWSYDKVLEVARELTITEGDRVVQWGFDKGALGAWWGAQTFGWAAGAGFFDRVIEPTKFTVSDPRNVEGLQWLRDTVYEHGISPDATQASAIAQDVSLFQTGKLAMVADGTWYMSSNVDSPFNWDMAPLPLWKGNRSLPFWFGGWVIAKDSQAPEAAIAWANWSATEYQKELAVNRDWIPIRREYRESPGYLSGLPAGFKSVVDTLPDAQIGDLYHGSAAQLVNEVMNPTFDQIWNNSATPADAAAEIDEKANALLARG
ncbi:MAG TPA: sugar ABC transporter substrate-binding protein [Roseiflexaceae bacterium]|nr:sugar ABC transporter substrate-binding protein [Roseiflexaceae bacterium]